MVDMRSLDRGLAVMAFIGAAETSSLRDVAASLSIPFSTAHRIVQSLIVNGYVIRHRRGSYALGPAVLALASRASLHAMLSEVGRPILVDLARQCRACTHLGIFDGEMVTYLVKRQFGRERIISAEGKQLEAYCSAIGKILLAHLPGDDRDRYLSGGNFVHLTPRTIVEPPLLEEELHRIRERGWAIDDEEIMPGLRCVAAPIFDAGGNAVAALSASIRLRSGDDDRIAGMRPLVQAAAERLADRLYADRG